MTSRTSQAALMQAQPCQAPVQSDEDGDDKPAAASTPLTAPTEVAEDAFHPNDRGYEIWADTFWPLVQNRVEESVARIAE